MYLKISDIYIYIYIYICLHVCLKPHLKRKGILYPMCKQNQGLSDAQFRYNRSSELCIGRPSPFFFRKDRKLIVRMSTVSDARAVDPSMLVFYVALFEP